MRSIVQIMNSISSNQQTSQDVVDANFNYKAKLVRLIEEVYEAVSSPLDVPDITIQPNTHPGMVQLLQMLVKDHIEERTTTRKQLIEMVITNLPEPVVVVWIKYLEKLPTRRSGGCVPVLMDGLQIQDRITLLTAVAAVRWIILGEVAGLNCQLACIDYNHVD